MSTNPAQKAELATVPEGGVLVATKSKEELRDDMVSSLKKINAKLKKVEVHTSAQFRTGGNFFFAEANQGQSISILSLSDIGWIVKAIAKCNEIKKNYEAAAEELGLTTYPVCQWNSIPIDNWIHDFKLRFAIVTSAKTLADLNSAKTKLEAFLSEDDRLTKALSEVDELLK